MNNNVVDPVTGKPRRLTEMCATCIMRPTGEAIPLRPGRLRQFLDEVRRADSFVVCHSTLMGDAEPAICRGYADRYTSNFLRICERLGGFLDVPPPTKGE